MRSSVGYLVFLMLMLAAFSAVRMNPVALVHLPGNLVVAGILVLGAIAVALRRPFSFPAGLVAAAACTIAGILSLRGYLGVLMPSSPYIWIVAGLYLAFRLSLNQHADIDSAQRSGAPSIDSAQRSGAPSIDSAQRSGAPSIDSAQRSGAPSSERVTPPRAQPGPDKADQEPR